MRRIAIGAVALPLLAAPAAALAGGKSYNGSGSDNSNLGFKTSVKKGTIKKSRTSNGQTSP